MGGALIISACALVLWHRTHERIANIASEIATKAKPNMTEEKNVLSRARAEPSIAIVTEEMARKEMQAEMNSKPMDTFGKVIDQYGNPVIDARATMGVLEFASDGIHTVSKQYYTTTDSEGKFHFIGQYGAMAGFGFDKKGYEYSSRSPSQTRNQNYSPDPAYPIIFKVWKCKGAEPMVIAQIHEKVPCDGSAVRFDLLKGKRVQEGGDMIVSLIRNPVNIVSGKHFEWSVTIESPDGGMIEYTTPHPYEAPADGYLAATTNKMPANMQHWTSEFTRSYYFKIRNGGIYGRMTVDIAAHFQPPPTPFNALIYANPSGSRNLELDPDKIVKGP